MSRTFELRNESLPLLWRRTDELRAALGARDRDASCGLARSIAVAAAGAGIPPVVAAMRDVETAVRNCLWSRASESLEQARANLTELEERLAREHGLVV